MAKNKLILSLRISDFDNITHDELTKIIDIQPLKVWVKGEKRNPKNPSSPLIKANSWLIDAPVPEYADFDEQMNALLDILESKIDVFRELSYKYYLEIGCAIFTYYNNGESTPWLHLGERYNKLIKEVNIEFDVDLYAWGNEDEER